MDKVKIKQEFDNELETYECELKTEDIDYAPLMSEFVIKVEPNESPNDVEIKSELADDMLVDSIETKTEECLDETSNDEIDIKTETYEEHPLEWESLKEEKIEDGLEKSGNKKEEHVKREKSFYCEVCKKSFNSKQYLKMHSRIHTGEKPFQCEVCNKSFNIKQQLSRHSRIHTGDRPFHCEVCNKSFTWKQTLINHLGIHIGEKPFQCEVCNKSFVRKQHLNRHSRIHTGEKPYKCEVCNQSFSSKGHLIYHSSTHTDEKPFQCEVCKKSFSIKGSLNVHSRIHIDYVKDEWSPVTDNLFETITKNWLQHVGDRLRPKNNTDSTHQ